MLLNIVIGCIYVWLLLTGYEHARYGSGEAAKAYFIAIIFFILMCVNHKIYINNLKKIEANYFKKIEEMLLKVLELAKLKNKEE